MDPYFQILKTSWEIHFYHCFSETDLCDTYLLDFTFFKTSLWITEQTLFNLCHLFELRKLTAPEHGTSVQRNAHTLESLGWTWSIPIHQLYEAEESDFVSTDSFVWKLKRFGVCLQPLSFCWEYQWTEKHIMSPFKFPARQRIKSRTMVNVRSGHFMPKCSDDLTSEVPSGHQAQNRVFKVQASSWELLSIYSQIGSW